MEVHHHSHTADPGLHRGKKWSHYFWEFLMLFLAVTLGFFVENQREHYVENKRERQFMSSLTEDLKDDITILSKQIMDGKMEIAGMDSLMYYLNNRKSSDQNSRMYYLARIASRHDIFNYNTRTIDQMRNSGAFRLVRKPAVANAITGYYREIRLLEMLEGVEKNEEQEYRKLAIKVFDPIVFESMVTEKDSIVSPSGNPPLRTTDPNILVDLSGWVQYLKSSVQGFVEIKSTLKHVAEDMVKLITDEYRLN